MNDVRFAFDHPGKEGAAFLVPDERLLAHLAPRRGRTHDLSRLVADALASPLGTRTVEQQAQRHDRATILIDDATRTTPVAHLLPPLVERLARGGIRDREITLLVAQGTHRAMGREELEAKLGDLVDRFRVVQHDAKDAASLVDMGTTEDGMPVIVNRLLGNDTLCIGLGMVAVHGIMGYSGGAKIAMIGAAGTPTETWTHWQAARRFQVSELMGVPGNPLRRNLDEGARMAGLDAVLNVAIDGTGEVQRVAYGEPVAVHRHLVPVVQEHHATHLPRQAEIAIIDTSPAKRDYWQSVKGLYTAELVVRDGGAAILVAPNPEGIADNHPNVAELAGLPYDEIVRRVDAGETDDVIGAAIAAYTARSRRHMRIHMVTSGISDNAVRGLGIEPADSIEQALEEATSALGHQAKVAVLERAGHLLPVVEGINSDRVRIPAYL